jgi:hypothetical protein
MPQNRISICTSLSVGSRRGIVVEPSDDVALAAEYAFVLYIIRSRAEFASFLILVAGDFSHPVGALTVKDLDHGDLGHGRAGCCAVPMLFFERGAKADGKEVSRLCCGRTTGYLRTALRAGSGFRL